MAGMPPVFAQSNATQNTSAEPTGGFNIERGVEDDRAPVAGKNSFTEAEAKSTAGAPYAEIAKTAVPDLSVSLGHL